MIGLSLSGGGAKGAFEVGAIEHLAEACGAPEGSQLREYARYLVECWNLLGKRKVWHKNPPWKWVSQPNIGDNAPLRALLSDLLDFAKAREGVPVEVAAWEMLAGKTAYLRSRNARDKADLVSMVMASCSFPVAFPPEDRGSEGYFTDGGITTINPVDRLVKAGCSDVLSISCRNPAGLEPKRRADFGNPVDAALRMVDGMENEVIKGDLEQVYLWNLLVDVGHPLAKGKRRIECDRIEPDEPLGNPLVFDEPTLTQRRRAVGRRCAKAYFDKNPMRLVVYARGFAYGAGNSVGAVNVAGLTQFRVPS